MKLNVYRQYQPGRRRGPQPKRKVDGNYFTNPNMMKSRARTTAMSGAEGDIERAKEADRVAKSRGVKKLRATAG